jgi:hypothetical protein
VLKILIDPLTLSYLSPYVKVLPLSLISLFLSSFVINDHKDSILDEVKIINVNQWGEDNFLKLVQSRTLAKDI